MWRCHSKAIHTYANTLARTRITNTHTHTRTCGGERSVRQTVIRITCQTFMRASGSRSLSPSPSFQVGGDDAAAAAAAAHADATSAAAVRLAMQFDSWSLARARIKTNSYEIVLRTPLVCELANAACAGAQEVYWQWVGGLADSARLPAASVRL